MVGLSIVLESQKGRIITTKTSPQVINKTTISKPSSSKIPTFLDQCFLCRSRLSPTKDIYMYSAEETRRSVARSAGASKYLWTKKKAFRRKTVLWLP
ncbi:FCS-Like Zinc finger 15-like [Senna tora]|uniref:FCS-Like Zinc finger 15-like n=1 Tax=Senna tora TaxID=362788 RepID=A0A834WXU4_9FABA|nr:FCS-Like Zinc finger 15-like [Senna tora]